MQHTIWRGVVGAIAGSVQRLPPSSVLRVSFSVIFEGYAYTVLGIERGPPV